MVTDKSIQWLENRDKDKPFLLVVEMCIRDSPDTYRALGEDMDVDAGRILEGRGSLQEVAEEIHAQVQAVANGAPSKSEDLGHREFILTYKAFEPIGPSCLPLSRAA